MKKTLSVILALVMALSVFAITGSAATTNDLTFYLASDIHYAASGETNAKGNMFNYSGAILDAFLKAAADSDAKAVILSGDMVETADAASVAAVTAKLAAFEASTGKSVFVIDGNHDVTASYSKDAFKAAYAQFGYDKAFAVDPNSCSYSADLDENTRVLFLDSVQVGASAGTLTTDTLNWANNQYANAIADGYTVLVVMHHPIVEHMPNMKALLPNYVLTNGDEAAQLFANLCMTFVFTGHDHITDIATYTTTDNTVVYDIGTGSLTADTCPYRVVEITDSAIRVNVKNITELEGVDDFAAYAKAQYKANCLSLVKNYLTTDFVAGKLGLEAGTASYTIVDRVMTYLNEFGGYDMGYLRQIASYADVAIPANDYASFNDCIAELIENMTAGNENVNATTPLYKVMYQCVTAILTYALAQESIDDETLTNAVNELVPKLTSLLSDKISDNIPTDEISGALADLASGNRDKIISGGTSLIFTVIISDYGVDDKPSDLSNGFINPFKHADKARDQSVWERILAFFHKILDYIVGIFTRK